MTLKNILDQSNWSILDDEEQFEKTVDRFQAVVKMKRRNMTSNYNEMPANLEKYLLGEVDFSELSDEEKIAFAQKTFLEFTAGGFPGSHPNGKGHQQRADAVMTAIGSSLNARQVKAIEISTFESPLGFYPQD